MWICSETFQSGVRHRATDMHAQTYSIQIERALCGLEEPPGASGVTNPFQNNSASTRRQLDSSGAPGRA